MTQDSLDSHTGPFIAPLTGDQLDQIKVDPAPKRPVKNQRNMLMIGIIIGTVLLVGIGSTVAFLNFKNSSTTATPTPEPPKRRIVEPTNIIPVEERPVVFLTPEADGRNLTLRVDSIKKPATNVEYALEYQAGELLQGVNGALELANLPAKTTQLMGSCSAGGKCSYHENVKGGTLLLRFLGAENYALKQDWKYIANKAKETAFSSKDAKFQLESPDLAKTPYLIIYNSPGYPEGVEGTVVSDPYSFQRSTTTPGKAKLTMRATETGELVIAGFDGTTWKEFTGTIDDKMITADVDLLDLYVVLKK